MTRYDYTENLPESVLIKMRYQPFFIPDGQPGACRMARSHFVADLSVSLHDIDHASASMFEPYPVGMLVDFLVRSHRYYMGKAIPELGYTLEEVLKNVPEGHPIGRFGPVLFNRFTDECYAHFLYEEQRLFPYALELDNSVRTNNSLPSGYSADRFVAEHPHSHLDLNKLTTYVTKLGQSLKGHFAFAHLTTRMQHLERDMKLHAIIEDDVLIPKLKKLENR